MPAGHITPPPIDIGDGLFLSTTILRNPVIRAILERLTALELRDCYLGAGCIAQTVWNVQHGYAPTAHIRDYDIAYFDPSDTSYDAEDRAISTAARLFADLDAVIEVRNQARVHLWFEAHFGYPIEPYRSIQDAIASWPATASCIGIGPRATDTVLCAPYGLADLIGCVARPNRRQVTREVYERKVARWRAAWPRLAVIPWDAPHE